jgi:hypothetical protein
MIGEVVHIERNLFGTIDILYNSVTTNLKCSVVVPNFSSDMFKTQKIKWYLINLGRIFLTFGTGSFSFTTL